MNFLKSPTFVIGVTVVLGVGFLLLLTSNKRAEEDAKPTAPYEVSYWGKADSNIVITEYGDFQCEACLNFFLTVEPRLKEQYKDSIRFEYKYLNLQGHRNSRIAAEATEAAKSQGKFWEFHDMLFEKQETEANGWNIDRLSSYAEELGLDSEQFRSELVSGLYKKTVEIPATEGANKGYNATPTVEINGVRVQNPTYETLKAEIDKLLTENQ